MSGRRVIALALAVLLPLTSFLVFAASGDTGFHPWSKQTHSAARAAVKLPSGIATTPTSFVPLPLVGRLAAQGPPPAPAIALRPPFIPPRVSSSTVSTSPIVRFVYGRGVCGGFNG